MQVIRLTLDQDSGRDYYMESRISNIEVCSVKCQGDLCPERSDTGDRPDR